MSRGVINCAKLCLGHPFIRIKSFDQWSVVRDPVSTWTASAKIGKTAIAPVSQCQPCLQPIVPKPIAGLSESDGPHEQPRHVDGCRPTVKYS